LKKRTKKLLLVSRATGVNVGGSRSVAKVFWFFFSKKNYFPCLDFLTQANVPAPWRG
jgi:hypothetical protein